MIEPRGGLSRLIFGLLLHAYPARLRRRYGSEMMNVVALELDAVRAEGSRAALWRFWVSILADTAVNAAVEHWAVAVKTLAYTVRLVRSSVGFTAVLLMLLMVQGWAWTRFLARPPGGVREPGLVFAIAALEAFVTWLLAASVIRARASPTRFSRMIHSDSVRRARVVLACARVSAVSLATAGLVVSRSAGGGQLLPVDERTQPGYWLMLCVVFALLIALYFVLGLALHSRSPSVDA